MDGLDYLNLTDIDPVALLPLLNKPSTRTHLMKHPPFDADSVKAWVQNKLAVDATPGCKVRAISLNQQLAGWCAIQAEAGHHEIALVIEDRFWGLGTFVFQDMMRWAKALGHSRIYLHLLETRREYAFLRKRSCRVHRSEIQGSQFISYELVVEKWGEGALLKKLS